MRSVQLFVPQLVPDLPDPASALSRFPALRRLLARARAQHSAADCFDALLCAAFGVPAQSNDCPVAALTLLADGHAPDGHCWLRADPVHLYARQNDLAMLNGAALRTSAAEAIVLVDALNRHFRDEGLEYLAPAPNRWYVRVPHPVRMRTTPLRQAVGRSIAALLPRGPDALAWQRRSNEAQMLLHAHPVNAAREAAAAPAINSLWFWGGGWLPECVAEVSVWADDPLARGLALRARQPLHALPLDGETWLERAGGGPHLLVLDLTGPEHGGFDQRIAHLDAAWLAPLLRALSRGALRELVLSTHHAGSALRFAAARTDLWKLWRRGYSLTHV